MADCEVAASTAGSGGVGRGGLPVAWYLITSLWYFVQLSRSLLSPPHVSMILSACVRSVRVAFHDLLFWSREDRYDPRSPISCASRVLEISATSSGHLRSAVTYDSPGSPFRTGARGAPGRARRLSVRSSLVGLGIVHSLPKKAGRHWGVVQNST